MNNDRTKNILSITASAILYGCAFNFEAAWPLVFIFLLPLFTRVLTRNCAPISLWYGFFFGLLAALAHLGTVFYSVSLNGYMETLWLRALPLIPAMLYTALLGILFFGVPKLVYRWTHNPTILCVAWIIGAWLYFESFAHWYMAPFGRIEGYVLTYPLVLFAHAPILALPIAVVGEKLALLVWIMFVMLIAHAIVACFTKNKRSFFIAAGSITVIAGAWLGCGWYMQHHRQGLSDFIALRSEIVHCPCFVAKSNDLFSTARDMAQHFDKAQALFPQAHTFVVQESATRIHQWPFMKDLCACFSPKNVHRPISIILGAFRWDGDTYHNTLYLFKNGKLTQWHDKRHAMALEERLPWLVNFDYIKNAFLNVFVPLTSSNEPRKPFTIYQNFEVIPYLCSELFFNSMPDETAEIKKRHIPILAACNDNWIQASPIINLMALYARYCAMIWNRPMVYASYHRGFFIAPNGDQQKLQAYRPKTDGVIII